MRWKREDETVPVVRRPVFGAQFGILLICTLAQVLHALDENNLGTPMTPAQAWLSLNHISTKLGRCSQVCPTVIASLDSYAEERLRDIMSAEDIEKTAPPAARERADQSKNIDPFDPLGWEVPVVCKDCDKRFK